MLVTGVVLVVLALLVVLLVLIGSTPRSRSRSALSPGARTPRECS